MQPPEQQPSFVVRAHDERSDTAPLVALAALRPPSAPRREGIALKILVDCSGSMGGDSIESARVVLEKPQQTEANVAGEDQSARRVEVTVK